MHPLLACFVHPVKSISRVHNNQAPELFIRPVRSLAPGRNSIPSTVEESHETR